MSESSTRWAVLQVTVSGGVQPYWAPYDDRINYSSFLFFTPRDAKRDLLEAWKVEIESHLGSPGDFDDDDFPTCEGWVEQVELHPDGTITAEGFEWSPADIYGFFGMEVPK